jgi:hypothetical protein
LDDIQQFDGRVINAANKYAQRITDCQRKSVESIIECGRLLIAAKDELKHGEPVTRPTQASLLGRWFISVPLRLRDVGRAQRPRIRS